MRCPLGPARMQLGGGVNLRNAVDWLEAGASQVIVTSWLFDEDGQFLEKRLRELASEVGREHVGCGFELSAHQVGVDGGNEPVADAHQH